MHPKLLCPGYESWDPVSSASLCCRMENENATTGQKHWLYETNCQQLHINYPLLYSLKHRLLDFGTEMSIPPLQSGHFKLLWISVCAWIEAEHNLCVYVSLCTVYTLVCFLPLHACMCRFSLQGWRCCIVPCVYTCSANHANVEWVLMHERVQRRAPVLSISPANKHPGMFSNNIFNVLFDSIVIFWEKPAHESSRSLIHP